MVVCEDIHSDDYDMRRHSHEDYGMRRHSCFVVSFSSLLSHSNHRTVKWVQVNEVSVTEVMLNQILCLRVNTMRANLIQSWMSQLYL